MNPNRTNLVVAAILIAFASIMKVSTFPYSVNPIIAISLFSGAIIKNRKWAFAMPLFAMFVSDIMLEVFNIAPGFYGMSQIGNYASLLLVTTLGFTMKKSGVFTVTIYSLSSSLLFFLLSNTNCFIFDNSHFYGTGFSGWSACLMAGIPFLKTGMMTDAVFSVLLFSSYAWYTKTRKVNVMA